MKNLIKETLIKRRIEKAWRKRMEDHDKVKMLVYASLANGEYKEGALSRATIYAEYWMIQHHGSHWREKTIMR